MALALYIISLAMSSGLVGVTCREILGRYGYVAGLDMGLLVAGAFGGAYAASQLLYMTLLRMLKPTQSPGPALVEVLSQAGAAALLPLAAHIEVPWPHPALEKAEVLVFLGAFGAIHVFFKLGSFYASIRGLPSGRFGAVGWLVGSVVLALVSVWCADRWYGKAMEWQPGTAGEEALYAAGDQWAMARVAPDGAVVSSVQEPYDNQCLTVRWANLPVEETIGEPLETIYVSARLEGDEVSERSYEVALPASGWAQMRIPSVEIPANLKRCSITWSAGETPSWQKLLGLPPLTRSSRRVLMSGPLRHIEAAQSNTPSVIILMVDGLGANHVSSLGYKRKTTPNLDALGAGGAAFVNAYTPAPEAAAACMSALTGVSPLKHGFLGKRSGPLPTRYQTLAEALQRIRYATAAFTESDGTGGSGMGRESGFDRGMEVFDSAYEATPPPGHEKCGSALTLQKAQAWVEQNAGQQFLLFVRLRELMDLTWRERYAPGFAPDGATGSPVDTYDSALLYLDGQIGQFVKNVRSSAGADNVCLVVAGSFGLDFGRGGTSAPTYGLTEESLHVPLCFWGSGVRATGRRDAIVTIEDIAATLLEGCRTGFSYVIAGKEILRNAYPKDVVSVYGSPLALSLRSDPWRFTWQSGQDPFTGAQLGDAGPVELFDVKQAAKRGAKQDQLARYEAIVERFTGKLKVYLEQERAP